MKKTLFALAFACNMLQAQTVTDYVTGAGNPTGIVFDAAGNLFIGDESNYAIKKFSAGTLSTVKTGMNGQPRQIILDNNNMLWGAFQALASIKEMNTSTGVSTSFPATNPFGIMDSGSNFIFFTQSDGKLVRYDKTTASMTEFPYNLTSPKGMAKDAAGNFYIATAGTANEIVKITPAGVITTFIDNIPNPQYLAFDASGNLYISTDYRGEIYKYGAGETDMIADVFVSGLNYTNGLAVYNNNLYCAIVSNGKVVKIALDALSTNEVKEDDFAIFPTMANDFVNLDTKYLVDSLEIYSAEGKLVKVPSTSKKIDISKLKSGVYFLKAKVNNKVISRKFIKK